MRQTFGLKSLLNFSHKWDAALFVYGIWVMMSLIPFIVLVWVDSPVVYFDDWRYVPVLVGQQPLSWEWLWSQHDEHRFPLTRLILWFMWRISGGDPRWSMALSITLMVFITFVLIRSVHILRGRSEYTDAIFPFLLLHGVNFEHFLLLIQLYYLTAVSLFFFVLLYLLLGHYQQTPWKNFGIAVCLTLLPLHGGMGMAYTPALAIPIGYLGFQNILKKQKRHIFYGCILLVGVLGAILSSLGYLWKHQGAVHGHVCSLAAWLSASLQCASMSLGILGPRMWPVSGILLVILMGITIGVLWKVWVNQKEERDRIFYMAAALAAALSLCLIIGFGRASLGVDAPRYIILCSPIIVILYFVWVLYGPVQVGRFIRTSLMMIFCAFSTYHLSLGMEGARIRRDATIRLKTDIQEGIPLMGIVGRHTPYWCWAEQPFREGLVALKNAGSGMFADICDDPPYQCCIIDPTPSVVYATSQCNGIWQGKGRDSVLSFHLDRPRFVYAVILYFTMTNEDEWSLGRFRMLWPSEEKKSWQPYESIEYLLKLRTGPALRVHTFWINQTIQEFHIQPDDGPFTLHLKEVILIEADSKDSEVKKVPVSVK